MLNLKAMGVINLTPNSFSDGKEISSLAKLQQKLSDFKETPILDFGAESTAPMNEAISADEELARFEPYLDLILSLDKIISIDTYHPETISFFQNEWLKRKKKNALVWNDISGKLDEEVEKFLAQGPEFSYVFCHNLAPTRELSASHMDYGINLSADAYLDHLITYFKPATREKMILDPCLGFSKTYEQNWFILDHFPLIQKHLRHSQWLIGFSRKSFLREKYGITSSLSDRELLDEKHLVEIKQRYSEWTDEVWLRTHRPQLLSL